MITQATITTFINYICDIFSYHLDILSLIGSLVYILIDHFLNLKDFSNNCLHICIFFLLKPTGDYFDGLFDLFVSTKFCTHWLFRELFHL